MHTKVKRALSRNYTNLNTMAADLNVSNLTLRDFIYGEPKLYHEYMRRKNDVRRKKYMKVVDKVKLRIDKGMTVKRACSNAGVSEGHYYTALRELKQ